MRVAWTTLIILKTCELSIEMIGEKTMANEMFSLAGKTAIVTGAAMGIGKAISMAFADAGANVVVADVNVEIGNSTVEEIREKGVDSMFCRVDVRSHEQIDAMVEAVLARFQKIDILMNNAGIGRPGAAVDVTPKDWQDVVDINLSGVFFVSQAVGKVMIKQGFGNIINTASMSAFIANYQADQASYYASKAGVVMLTKALAAEWAQYGIRVNGIAPGVTLTDQTNWLFKDPCRAEYVKTIMNWTPLGRPANPSEMGGACVYLASGASSYMTGHIMVIDGGHTIH